MALAALAAAAAPQMHSGYNRRANEAQRANEPRRRGQQSPVSRGRRTGSETAVQLQLLPLCTRTRVGRAQRAGRKDARLSGRPARTSRRASSSLTAAACEAEGMLAER